jgi:hypothetical protein
MANPKLRGVFAEYLIQKGLSEADSRRISDAAMAGLGECLQAVFGPGDTYEKGEAFLACKGSVLQEHGLSEADIGRSIYGP